MTNKEVVVRFFTDGYVLHDYDSLMRIVSDDYFDHSICAARSNRECVEILKNTQKVFPDMQVEVQDLIEEDNKITIRAVFTGTHSAPIYNVPTTHKKISFEALEIFRVDQEKIVESWGYWPDGEIIRLLTEEESR